MILTISIEAYIVYRLGEPQIGTKNTKINKNNFLIVCRCELWMKLCCGGFWVEDGNYFGNNGLS